MKIKELTIRKTDADKLHISWSLSDGDQTSYELFLIRGGSVAEQIKENSAAMKCTLQTTAEPMRDYALLLTVRSGELLSTARAGFFSGKDTELCRCMVG